MADPVVGGSTEARTRSQDTICGDKDATSFHGCEAVICAAAMLSRLLPCRRVVDGWTDALAGLAGLR